jgi:hypothetical protein
VKVDDSADNTSNNSAGDKLAKREGTRLNDDTNQSDAASQENSLATPQFVSKPGTDQSAKSAPDFIDSDCRTCLELELE